MGLLRRIFLCEPLWRFNNKITVEPLNICGTSISIYEDFKGDLFSRFMI